MTISLQLQEAQILKDSAIMGQMKKIIELALVDMEKAILREISIKNLNVCIPYEYHVAYINGSENGGSNLITYNTIDQRKTQSSLDSRKANILLSHKQRLKRKNKDLSGMCKNRHPKSKMRTIWH